MAVAARELEITGTGGGGLTVRTNVSVSVPPELEAVMVTLLVPAVVGVPEMTPVVGLFVRPAGRLLAPKEVGAFEARIE